MWFVAAMVKRLVVLPKLSVLCGKERPGERSGWADEECLARGRDKEKQQEKELTERRVQALERRYLRVAESCIAGSCVADIYISRDATVE